MAERSIKRLKEIASELGVRNVEKLDSRQLRVAIVLYQAIAELYQKAEWLGIELPPGIKNLGSLQRKLHDAVQKRLDDFEIDVHSQLLYGGKPCTVKRIQPRKYSWLYWLCPTESSRWVAIDESRLLSELQKEGRA